MVDLCGLSASMHCKTNSLPPSLKHNLLLRDTLIAWREIRKKLGISPFLFQYLPITGHPLFSQEWQYFSTWASHSDSKSCTMHTYCSYCPWPLQFSNSVHCATCTDPPCSTLWHCPLISCFWDQLENFAALVTGYQPCKHTLLLFFSFLDNSLLGYTKLQLLTDHTTQQSMALHLLHGC